MTCNCALFGAVALSIYTNTLMNDSAAIFRRTVAVILSFFVLGICVGASLVVGVCAVQLCATAFQGVLSSQSLHWLKVAAVAAVVLLGFFCCLLVPGRTFRRLCRELGV